MILGGFGSVKQTDVDCRAPAGPKTGLGAAPWPLRGHWLLGKCPQELGGGGA